MTRRGGWCLLLASLFGALPAAGRNGAEQALTAVDAPAGSVPVLLSGADLHTVGHGVIEAGELLIVDGRIAALGKRVEAPPGTRRIALAGKRIYPGLIAANTILGLTEMPIVASTNDFSELGVNNAHLQASLALKADTRSWPVARAAGVLTALVAPKAHPAGLVSGRSALVRGTGRTGEAQLIRDDVGVHMSWPRAMLTGDDAVDAPRRAALEARLDTLRDLFARAQAYRDIGLEAQRAERDWALDALLPVLSGERPLFVHADGIVQIRQALAFARQRRIAMVLVGGSDAWRMAGTLREQQVPVILGSAHRLPSRRWEANDTVYAAAGRLLAAGVKVAIANDTHASSLDERNLAHRAASYAAHGLGSEAALRAITLTPAEILGVDAQLGSLEAGKAATLFVSDGDILDVRTRVESAWIDGREESLESHHRTLLRTYSQPAAETR